MDLRIIRVRGGIAVTQGIHNIGQGIMLPADQDIPAARVVVYNLGHTLLVITVAGGINGDTKVGS